MVFYAAFNSISVISRRQLTLFMLSWVSPVLGWALKCLAEGDSHEKTQRIQCGSNPGPLDYESNASPLSHVGPKYTGRFHESENVVNILSINSILVNIDIISGSYVNGTTKNTIYSFFPKVSPGYKIIEWAVNLVYLPITLDTIDSLEVSITDQDDHLLNLRNEKLTIRFHIREAR